MKNMKTEEESRQERIKFIKEETEQAVKRYSVFKVSSIELKHGRNFQIQTNGLPDIFHPRLLQIKSIQNTKNCMEIIKDS
jgi:hypothetical protein